MTGSRVRIACDSLVALASASADGATLFAKNSDRPADECQPLQQLPRATHAVGTRLRCTYIEIPQVAETARLIGSRPFWCWGFEHGLNEHGVAIGNHSVFTKDPVSGLGLIGMDLVRLGLERGRTATEAVAVITGLLEQYGQGGSGYGDKQWPYHNSFLIADRRAAFVLETSDRHWAVRRVLDVGSVSNHLTIGADWDALSDGAIEHAIAAGWWPEETDERFNFAAAYRDSSVVPDVVSSGRHQRTCALLDAGKGSLSVGTLKLALRDHYDRQTPAGNHTPADPQYFSVCMHAEPVGTTTASMAARLPATSDEPLVYWASLGSPCIGVFLPLYLDADIPAVLCRGSQQAAPDAAWWQFKALLTKVERDWERHLPRVRSELDALESALAAEAAACLWRGVPARTAFMQTAVETVLSRSRSLTDSL